MRLLSIALICTILEVTLSKGNYQNKKNNIRKQRKTKIRRIENDRDLEQQVSEIIKDDSLNELLAREKINNNDKAMEYLNKDKEEKRRRENAIQTVQKEIINRVNIIEPVHHNEALPALHNTRKKKESMKETLNQGNDQQSHNKAPQRTFQHQQHQQESVLNSQQLSQLQKSNEYHAFQQAITSGNHENNGDLSTLEQLHCKQNVIDFVINATDVKDECDGFRRAFDATCSMIQDKRRNRHRKLLSLDSSIWSRMSKLKKRLVKMLFKNPQNLVNDIDLAWNNSIEKEVMTSNRRLSASSMDEDVLPLLSLPTNQHVDYQMITKSLLLEQPKANVNNININNKIFNKRKIQNKYKLHSKKLDHQKTCCASILTVYHNHHCDANEDSEDYYNDAKLCGIVMIIVICSIVKSLIRYFEIRWLPEAAGCILVGVVGGAILPETQGFNEKLFLSVMLPPIVFEAAISINKRAFLKHVIPILCYALVGTVFCAFCAAFILHEGSKLVGSTQIPIVDSLLFGTLISSIDPIAVLSILNNMGVKDTNAMYVIIFGESLLNDGVAIVLYDTLVGFLSDDVTFDSSAIWNAIEHFINVATGSVLIGSFCGVLATCYFWAMTGCHSPLVEVLSFFCWALVPYYLCDGMKWSGIVALVATGFIMDLYVIGGTEHSTDEISGEKIKRKPFIFGKGGHMSNVAKTHVHFVTLINSTLMETAIFAYLGLFLFSSRYHWSFQLSAVSIFSCIASRGLMIFLFSRVSNWIRQKGMYYRSTGILREKSKTEILADQSLHNDSTLSSDKNNFVDSRMQVMLWFAGLRGAMSFALVENIHMYDRITKTGSRFKPELKAMTSASVAFSVFVLGGSTFYVLERLGMNNMMAEKEDFPGEMKSILAPYKDDLEKIHNVDIGKRNKGQFNSTFS